MSGKIAGPRPMQNVEAVERPAWYTEIPHGKNGSVVQLHHPHHGWLTFLLPPDMAFQLGAALVRQSALCDYFAGTVPASTMTVQ